MEAMAFAKACMMLANLESEGTRVLTLSIPEPDRHPIMLLPARTEFQPQYAMVAATVILTAVTFASIGSVDRTFTQSSMPLVNVPTTVSAQATKPAEVLSESSEPVNPAPKRKVRPRMPEYIVQAKYTRPFLPPNGDVEAPELDMTQVPPPVYAARRLDAPAALVRLPDAPKKRVRRSRRVLNALASPFKKIGGALAILVIGRQERAGI
jgi:hypothetical protein